MMKGKDINVNYFKEEEMTKNFIPGPFFSGKNTSSSSSSSSSSTEDQEAGPVNKLINQNNR